MWSPAFESLTRSYEGIDGWTELQAGCPVSVQAATLEHLTESSGFDCSVDDSFALQLPCQQLVAGLGLSWSGTGADYVDTDGNLAAFDPTVHEEGPSALLIREDLLRRYLSDRGLAVCWMVQGEKLGLPESLNSDEFYIARIAGVYALGDNGPEGVIEYRRDESKPG